MIAATPEEAEKALAALRKARAEEEAYAAVNLHLVEADWLQKMRAAKVKELLSEAAATVELQQRKNELHVQSLEALLQASQDLSTRVETSESSHQRLIASIVSNFESELRQMHSQALGKIYMMQKCVAEECIAATKSHEELCRSAKDDLQKLQQAHTASLGRISARFARQKRALLDFWDERCGVTRILGEEKLQALASASHTEAKTFSAETREARQHHDALLKEDQEDSEAIEIHSKQLVELQKEIETWRERLANDAESWKLQIADAKAIKGKALAKHAALQREVGQARKQQEQRLKALSVEGASAEEELAAVVERAERIVKALELRAKQVSRRS